MAGKVLKICQYLVCQYLSQMFSWELFKYSLPKGLLLQSGYSNFPCLWNIPCLQDSNFRSSQRRCSVRKGVLRNFGKFTEKDLCRGLQLYLKRDHGKGVFL